MSQTLYDAIIVGGGPGGSAAATYLGRAGKRVLVLEKEHFPRFHIGESLLPYNTLIFEEMGVLPKLEAAGFMKKFGAQFHIGNSSKALKMTFCNGRYTRQATAFQVERSIFDDLLLNHANVSGAEVRQGWAVTDFNHQGSHVTVQARSDRGVSERLDGAFLIDASGRANFSGNLEGTRVVHPQLKKLALFGQFEGVRMDQGPKAGDIIIVRLENKWFWLIPLSPTKVSVGCVMDREEFIQARLAPSEFFIRVWQSSAEMRGRMEHSIPINALQTTSDFSYYNRRLVGPRLLRVGDAAGFMDPIFSAGVYLAMYSGKLASQAVLNSLAAGADGASSFKAYEKEVFRAMRYYWDMVEAFYTTPFIELFLQPRPKFHLPDAIIATLAGELDGGWRLAWRQRLFFWLVQLQARCPLVPRISFVENVPSSKAADTDGTNEGAPTTGKAAWD